MSTLTKLYSSRYMRTFFNQIERRVREDLEEEMDIISARYHPSQLDEIVETRLEKLADHFYYSMKEESWGGWTSE